MGCSYAHPFNKIAPYEIALSSPDYAEYALASISKDAVINEVVRTTYNLHHYISESDAFFDDHYHWSEKVMLLGKEGGNLVFFTSQCAVDVGYAGNTGRFGDGFGSPEYYDEYIEIVDGESKKKLAKFKPVEHKIKHFGPQIDFALIYIDETSPAGKKLSSLNSVGLENPTNVVESIANNVKYIFGVKFVLRSQQCDSEVIAGYEKWLTTKKVGTYTVVVVAVGLAMYFGLPAWQKLAVGVSKKATEPLLSSTAKLARPVLPKLSLGRDKRLPNKISREIERIIDGDTLVLKKGNKLGLAGKARHLRLIGINTPELRNKYGLDAKNMLGKMIGSKQVIATLHGQDKYGRSLANLFLPESKINVSHELLRRGIGRLYIGNKKILRKYPGYIRAAKGALRDKAGFAGEWVKDAAYNKAIGDLIKRMK